MLLIRYNKVTNESFENIAKYYADAQFCTLSSSVNDHLSYKFIAHALYEHKNTKAILVGDVFWPTGQNICQWCKENNIKCYFLQHGQWIYVSNKQNIKYLPYATFFFGDDIAHEASTWPYGQHSKIFVTGSPRYDDLSITDEGFVYFSPPILVEKNPSAPPIIHHSTHAWLKTLAGIDSQVNIMLQPHYREGRPDLLKLLFPKASFCNPDDPALSIISRCHKVLTHRNSTVALDAIACRKHLVLMNFVGFDISCYARGYFDRLAADTKNLSECAAAINSSWVAPDDYENKARHYILLGNAALRIIKYVHQTDSW